MNNINMVENIVNRKIMKPKNNKVLKMSKIFEGYKNKKDKIVKENLNISYYENPKKYMKIQKKNNFFKKRK